MNILVTGSNGFIGKNLVTRLRELDTHEVTTIDKENSKEELKNAVISSHFIIHLAGVNRPKDEKEFFEGNNGLTEEIVEILKANNKKTPILITSSIQVNVDNSYGKSKRLAEEALLNYKKETGGNVYIYRLPNVFGKWCRPNYNSAIATFCHNIARDQEVWISDPSVQMTLVYIDDVVRCIIETMETVTNEEAIVYKTVDVELKSTLGEIVELIKSFRTIKKTSIIPNLSDELTKDLYSTYLSYLDDDDFSYELDKKVDNRGWLAELVKSKEFGQMFVSKTKPGVTRGNHYHHTKVEKFIVIQGKADIKFRHIENDKVITYTVEGEKPTVLDIPPGYTHSITNVGREDVITLFWVNEMFNQNKPDTTFNLV